MRCWMLVVWFVAVVGCRNPVETLVVSPDTLLLTSQGQEAILSTTTLDKKGQKVAATVEYSSSDETVATVSAQGKVTAHKSGDATVVVHAGPRDERVRVQVRIPSFVAVVPEAVVLKGLGSTTKLSARVLDEREREIPGAAVTWAVDPPERASVVNGTVTALGVGFCRVSASFGSISAVSTVVIELPDFESLVLEPSQLSLAVGRWEVVLASMTDADGKRVPGIPIAFETSSPEVAAVDSVGRITGISSGTAIITAHAATRSASVVVTVSGGE